MERFVNTGRSRNAKLGTYLCDLGRVTEPLCAEFLRN